MFISPKPKFGNVCLTGISPSILQSIYFSRSLTKLYLKFRSHLVIQLTNHWRRGQCYMKLGARVLLENQDEWWSGLPALLTKKLWLFAIPGHHGPYTSQYIKHEAPRSVSVTKTSFNVPKLPHFFFFFAHQHLQPRVILNVHPSTGGNSSCSEKKFLPKTSGQGGLSCQARRIPGGAWGRRCC